jgi:UDP-glucose 4-epimerase
VPAKATFLRCDVTSADQVAEVFDRYKFDYVYHLAAYAAEGLSHFIRGFNYRNNLVGSANVLNAAVNGGVKCFVFTSSIAVYGALPPPMAESMTPHPEDPYGIAKYAVELDLAAARHMFGINHVIFRPHNVYGERQNIADRYRNVLGIFMNQVMSGNPMTIFGESTQTRAFSYVADVAPLIARSVEVPEAYNRVFNIGADEPHTVRRLGEVVARSFGKEPDFVHLPARNEVLHAFASHDLLREVFGTSPTVPLEEGVERMARWATEVGPRPPVTFENIEVRRGLPPSWAL